MLEAEASPNVQNFKGNTPLHMSVGYGIYYTTKLFLEAGANEHVKNQAGHTAISGLRGACLGRFAWDNAAVVLLHAGEDKPLWDLGLKQLQPPQPTPFGQS